ncbi:hypothetical protein I4U23_007675 [Adineta vaga]|nr:hypothetical protein I4U23_007675 [Adineta vaga]
MEYRFFYPINEDLYRTRWRERSGLEKRADIYFILPEMTDKSDSIHIEYGLKLRKGKKLELKKRVRRFSNGQEYWIKTIHTLRSIHLDDMNSIIKVLKKSNETQLIERLMSVKPMIVCNVSKFRNQSPTEHGLIQELTGLHLKFIRSDNQMQIGHDLFYETVCIEQIGSNLIHEKIIEKLIEQHRHIPIEPMGYPEFLFRQYQQIIN